MVSQEQVRQVREKKEHVDGSVVKTFIVKRLIME